MRIDQALSILRRAGFVILVVASSLAKAQAGPSLEREQAHGRVDPAVQILEYLSGASTARVSPRTLDPSSGVAAARKIDLSELRREHSERFAVQRWARRGAGMVRHATGSERQSRSRGARSRARRTGSTARPPVRLSARRSARRRRRAGPAAQELRAIAPRSARGFCPGVAQRASFLPSRCANISSRGVRLVDASTTRCGASPWRRTLGVRGCSHAASRFTGATMGSSSTRRCGTAPEVVSLPPAVLPCVQPIDLIKELQ